MFNNLTSDTYTKNTVSRMIAAILTNTDGNLAEKQQKVLVDVVYGLSGIPFDCFIVS